ncbi:MAG: ATP-binding cassette domain-containing protein [Propionibacteriaceae bacterium]|nr:ATP-binding cassette domain-containing protein [Propionibacteriaceae bacterium]
MSIAVNSMGVSLGGLPIVKDISFQIDTGQTVAVLGSNGSGKTTLIKAILGLHSSSGQVEIMGTALHKFRAWKKIGYVPQRATVSLHSTTVSEVVESGLLSGRSLGWVRSRDRHLIAEALELVGLTDQAREPYLHLSGGQQQRVLIARGIVHHPDILIMDEPFAGVDLDFQAEIITALSRMGSTIVVVLHETSAWTGVLDRTLILREGRLVHDGPLAPSQSLDSMDSATNAQKDGVSEAPPTPSPCTTPNSSPCAKSQGPDHTVGTTDDSLLSGMEPRWNT